jgi:phage gpG-like protein
MAALSFRLTRNDVSPALSRMAAAAHRPEPIFRAMGTTFLSLIMGNFKSAEYRTASWPAKKDGTPATLQKSGTLSRAFHLTVTNTRATVSNPMVYAAIHQFGAKDHQAGSQIGSVTLKNRHGIQTHAVMSGSKGIPPRPFFPVDSSGHLTPKSEAVIRAAGERAAARQFSQ